MTYFEDLSPCSYFGAENASQLVAIGWLEKGREYTRGDLTPGFGPKLVALMRDAWQPVHFMGPHFCQYCRITRAGGVKNLLVPGDGFLYVAPELVVHYVDAHEYTPPLAFQQAVLACPPAASHEYRVALLRNGPRSLILGHGAAGA